MANIDKLTIETGRIYAQAERDIIQRIANRLKRDKTADIQVWELKKLRELQKLRSGIEMQIKRKLDNYVDKELQGIIEEIYSEGSEEAIKNLNNLKSGEVISAFGTIDEQTVENYVNALTDSLKGTHIRMLRQSDDVYRRAVSRGVETVLTGSGTRLEGSQRVLNDFANKGVGGFVDSAGKSWNLKTYAEMATRTVAARARIDGKLNRYQQNDEDLVVVSAHGESCPLCDPYEGRVLSISGNSEQYPSVEEATSNGLFHANCTHNITLYLEGITDKPEPQEGGESYEERQQQRYLERGVRKWKRRQAGSMTDRETRKSDAKVNEWQQRLRDFTNKTGRRRKYEREQITQAR